MMTASNFNLNDLLKRFGALVLLPWLAACANMESGMRIETQYVPSSSARSQPSPVIKLITPDLLQSERIAKAGQSNQDIQPLLGEPTPYLIGPGDLLSILVWDHPELNIAATGAQALSSSGAQTPAAYVVDQNGMVQFPYVGAVRLSGLTELEARNLLTERMVKSIKRPDITLRVQTYRSKRLFVDGEVKNPGNQVIDDVPMTLPEALTRAGGLLPSADQSHIVITRSGRSYPVSMPLLVQQGINPARVVLASGDVVRVHNRDENKVYVLGEVNTPKALAMFNGRMTLTQALGEAGGLNQVSAAAKQVYVVRNATDAEPIVYNLDAQSPVALALADNFELNPHDVVFVDASGLARFNRIISLILPSAVGATTSYRQVKP